MFTGITRGTFPVTEARRSGSLLRYAVELPSALARGLEVGASVAIDGVCQTVVTLTEGRPGATFVAFEAIEETLRKTTLGALLRGSTVSVERSAKVADELGGHLLAGHVHGTGQVVSVHVGDGAHDLQIRVPRAFMKYVLPKGFIAIDGSSLTVGETNPLGSFWLHLIPETLRLTNLGQKGPGELVNVELDARTVAIVDTVERVLGERAANPRGSAQKATRATNSKRAPRREPKRKPRKQRAARPKPRKQLAAKRNRARRKGAP